MCPALLALICPALLGLMCPALLGLMCPALLALMCPALPALICPALLIKAYHIPTYNQKLELILQFHKTILMKEKKTRGQKDHLVVVSSMKCFINFIIFFIFLLKSPRKKFSVETFP